MANSIEQNLPEYGNPPVVEVVCSLLFKPIETLLAPHLGVLWDTFKPEYSDCSEAPMLVPSIERFGKTETSVEFEDLPTLPRTWFVQKEGNGIIQVQRDRFIINWRKIKPDDKYPRYHNVIDKFRKYLSIFRTFLEENKIGLIEPLQYELTYVNHIPMGEGWEKTSDIGKIFNDFSWKNDSNRILSNPEIINWRTSFVLPEKAGRLHITIRNAFRRSDNKPLILLEITARGIYKDISTEAMWRWFDLARQWIVRGFSDITSDEIQNNIWRRES